MLALQELQPAALNNRRQAVQKPQLPTVRIAPGVTAVAVAMAGIARYRYVDALNRP